jgi:hypothetical protein
VLDSSAAIQEADSIGAEYTRAKRLRMNRRTIRDKILEAFDALRDRGVTGEAASRRIRDVMLSPDVPARTPPWTALKPILTVPPQPEAKREFVWT